MKLSIIIPAYNEEKTIKEIVDRVILVVLPSQLEKEIVVVNDGSTDNTAKILEQYTRSYPIKILNHSQNKGKSKTIVTGIESSSGDIILIQDADLEYSPMAYPNLVSPILEGQASIVYGSRFKGSIEGMTLINRLANIITNITFNFMYGVHMTDINTCYKVFKKEMLQGITIISDNFAFETEITVKFLRHGHQIIEIPISYSARTIAEGKKIRWRSAFQMYWGMFKYRNYFKPLN